jgi:hypothetical protein
MVTAALFLLLSQSPKVQDEGDFFTPETLKKAAATIARIKERFQKDVFLETLKTIPPSWRGKYDPKDRQDFFRKLLSARAEQKNLDGVYILLCRRPRWFQIGADRLTEKKSFSKVMQDRVRKVLEERFAKEDYDKGLLELLAIVEQALAGVLREQGQSRRKSAILVTREIPTGSASVLLIRGVR